MKRQELADNVAKRIGITKADAREVVKCVFEEIAESLRKGEDVVIPRMFTFRVLERSARVAFDPKRKVMKHMAPTRYVHTSTALWLKNLVKEDSE